MPATAPQNPQPDSLLRWMAGLTDPSRLRLLRLLERQELGVSDLCEVVQMPQSTVSRHLTLLGDEGWTISRRRGTTNLYRMLLDELDPGQRELWLLTRQQTEDWATFHQDQVRLLRLLADQRQSAQAYFADAAGQWDNTRAQLYGPTFERAALTALLPPAWVVADLGCGTGTLSVEISPYVRSVIAVDNSKAMLDAASQRIAGRSNIELRQGDLEALPIERAEADAALCVLVLSYLRDPAAAIGEIARILKPGGLAVVVDLLKHDREDFRREMGQLSMGFAEDELTGLLTDAGFSPTTCHALPPHPDAKGPALLLARGMKQ